MKRPFVPLLACLALALSARAATYTLSAGAGSDVTASLNSLLASAHAGDVVAVPLGTFVLSGRINVPSGVTLQGAGKWQTTLQVAPTWTGGTAQDAAVSVAGTNTTVQNLGLDGHNVAVDRNGINAFNVTNVHLANLNLQNFADGKGVYIRGGDQIFITDSYLANLSLSGSYAAIWVQSAGASAPTTHINILRNTIANVGRQGIWCSDWVHDSVISGNAISSTAKNGDSEGMHLGGHDNQRMTVEDNAVDRWISLTSGNDGMGGDYLSTDVAIRHNTVVPGPGSPASYAGIEIVGNPVNLVVTENACSQHQRGFALTSGGLHYAYVAHNTVGGCSQYGIMVSNGDGDYDSQVYFRSNSVTANAGQGMIFIPDTHAISYVDLDGNAVGGNAGYYAIELNSTNVFGFTFVGNTITNNAHNALNYPAGASVDWVTNGAVTNTVTGNGGNGHPSTTGMAGNPRPVVQFAYTKAGNSVTFTNTSTGAARYLWDFDAGLPSTATNPFVVFPAAGTYRVSLVGWTATGRGAVFEEDIMVP